MTIQASMLDNDRTHTLVTRTVAIFKGLSFTNAVAFPQEPPNKLVAIDILATDELLS